MFSAKLLNSLWAAADQTGSKFGLQGGFWELGFNIIDEN